MWRGAVAALEAREEAVSLASSAKRRSGDIAKPRSPSLHQRRTFGHISSPLALMHKAEGFQGAHPFKISSYPAPPIGGRWHLP